MIKRFFSGALLFLPLLAHGSTKADVTQAFSRDPLSLTCLPNVVSAAELDASHIIVSDQAVILLNRERATVLERTAKGLVRRQDIALPEEIPVLPNVGWSFAAPDARTFLYVPYLQGWQLQLNSNFELSVTKTNAVLPHEILVVSEDNSQFGQKLGTSITTYRMTSQGPAVVGSLQFSEGATALTAVLNAGAQILAAIVDDNVKGPSLQFFKLNGDKFVLTDSQPLESDNTFYDKLVYDADLDEWVVSGGADKVKTVKVAVSTGKISAVSSGSSLWKTSYSFKNGVVKNNYAQLYDRGESLLFHRQTTGSGLTEITDWQERRKYFAISLQNKPTKSELWINDSAGLTQYRLDGASRTALLTRSAAERGLMPSGGFAIPNPDHKIVFWHTNENLTLFRLNSQQQIEVLGSRTKQANESFWLSPALVQPLPDNKYLLLFSDRYMIVALTPEGKVEFGNIEAQVGGRGSRIAVSYLDGRLYVSNNGLHVYRVEGMSLVPQTRFTDTALNEQELSRVDKVVKLNGKHWLLLPEYAKAVELLWQGEQLKAGKQVQMPVVSGPFEQGLNKVFSTAGFGLTLEQENVSGNLLQTSKGTAQSEASYRFYNPQTVITKQYFNSGYAPFPFQVQSVTNGDWQDITINPVCLAAADTLIPTNGHLLAISYSGKQMKLAKLNTAPYLSGATLPVIPEGKAISLHALAVDTEDDKLIFSTNQPGFTVSESGLLQFKAGGASEGQLDFTVSDAEFSTQGRVAYRVNLLPKLQKSLPTITAVAGESIQVELAGFVIDPEGSSLQLTFGKLPEGLEFKGTVLGGNISAAGSYNLQLTATDAEGLSAEFPLAVTITVKVTKPSDPVIENKSSSGGGAVSWWSLAALMLLVSRRLSFFRRSLSREFIR